jgi:hypothetical protein
VLTDAARGAAAEEVQPGQTVDKGATLIVLE